MFPRLRPTENAEAQMLKVIEGASIRFTRIGMGNGEEPSVDIEQLTEMQNLICYGTITSYERNGKNAIIHWQLDTASVESAFDWTEYALFAMDENDNEFLFSYSYNVGKVQPIEAAASDSMVMLEMDINITIGDAENVSAIIGEYSAYASKEVVNDHINDKNNPHIVTAEQLGLGNVDNVSTDEAKPSFTASNTLQELNSGETASTLFGKLKTAVKSLIDHISNTNNPHKDTPEKIGAAAKSHTHNASDINAGVLSAARGGTGSTSINNFISDNGLDFFRVKEGYAADTNGRICVPLNNGLTILMGVISIYVDKQSYGEGGVDFSPTNFFSRSPYVFVTANSKSNGRNATVTAVSRKGFTVILQNNTNAAGNVSAYYFAIG